MHLILTGATGLVGSGVLHHILSLPATSAASKRLNRLSIVARRAEIPLLSHPDRPTANTFTKIEVIPHSDFKTYPPELLSKLQPDEVDGKLGVIWALGISQTEVNSDQEYVTITKEFALEAAKALSTSLLPPTSSSVSSQPSESEESSKINTDEAKAKAATKTNTENKPQQLNFIYVSGEGATHTPTLLTPLFGRVKGETEAALLDLSRNQPFSDILNVYNVRPAAVDAIHQPAVADLMKPKDQSRGLGYRLLKAGFLPLLRKEIIMSGTWSPTEELGTVFVELALGPGGSLLKKNNNNTTTTTTISSDGKISGVGVGVGVGVEGWEGRVVRNVGIRRLFREYTSIASQ